MCSSRGGKQVCAANKVPRGDARLHRQLGAAVLHIAEDGPCGSRDGHPTVGHSRHSDISDISDRCPISEQKKTYMVLNGAHGAVTTPEPHWERAHTTSSPTLPTTMALMSSNTPEPWVSGMSGCPVRSGDVRAHVRSMSGPMSDNVRPLSGRCPAAVRLMSG